MKISKERLCVLQCRSGLTGAQVAAKAGLKPRAIGGEESRHLLSTYRGSYRGRFDVPVEEILKVRCDDVSQISQTARAVCRA